jgi:hypothetical protein
MVMPGAERVIEYHLMARGSGWGEIAGQPAIRLNEGDLIVFPQGDAHILSSAPGMGATPDLSMFRRPTTPLPRVYEFGGGGSDRARIVCCFLGCDERPFNPLLAALPRVIHLSAAAHGAAAGWLATLINIAVRESGSARAGSENILSRLSELMFVEALRRYLEALPPTQTGWLGAARSDCWAGISRASRRCDGGVDGRAPRPTRRCLALHLCGAIHRDGRTAADAVSRMWRMQLASRLLAEGGQVAAVAAAVGHESEAAFSRAFKKLVGRAPAAWRRAATPNSSKVRR